MVRALRRVGKWVFVAFRQSGKHKLSESGRFDLTNLAANRRVVHLYQPTQTSARGKSRAPHGASRCSRCSLAPLFPHSSRSASLATPAMAPHDDVTNHPRVPDDVASLPRVLVLGSPSVGKTTLAHRLTAAHPHEYSSTSSNTAAGECFSWQVDTKYYTAAVAVWTARLSSVLPCGTTTGPVSPLVTGTQALLLVFDLSN
ncbi:unnamed protein product, partial [Closterium sp. NIES-53]